jgi:hypothetical protein
MKAYVYKEICAQMLIAVLFIMAKKEKQLMYQVVGGQIKCVSITEYYSAMKSTKVLTHRIILRNFKQHAK